MSWHRPHPCFQDAEGEAWWDWDIHGGHKDSKESHLKFHSVITDCVLPSLGVVNFGVFSNHKPSHPLPSLDPLVRHPTHMYEEDPAFWFLEDAQMKKKSMVMPG